MTPFKNLSIVRLLLIILGAVLAAIGLELFLIPHAIIVGGATGLSALLAYWTDMRIGFVLFMINLPFILLSYRKISRPFVSITIISLFVFALSAIVLHPYPSLIEDAAIAAICGGISLGAGIGLVVRFGGSLDATENTIRSTSPAMLASGPRIKFMNTIILLSAGFLFGWTQALYSTVAYLLAVEMVSFVLNKLSLQRTIWIQSRYTEDICKALQSRLNMKLSYMPDMPSNPYSNEKLLSATIHVFEVSRMKAIVMGLDPDASFHTKLIK
ncbi:YitT family protein [Paenibacillus sp. N1-5-1-14]|uniref:YitT family protein n=1 Tax=Paenibacillus radicibacter TaxID=2972488 RepID=UPI002158A82E|nr:YitT family protein [Paenibacillus radicibacter]MCR8643870.1 YitT family protein [Paenibacillus radicibacter]